MVGKQIKEEFEFLLNRLLFANDERDVAHIAEIERFLNYGLKA